jgi:RNA polymerase sigma-70 factor (ECF subfamily)
MSVPTCCRSFEQEALPHLKSAYNLARWLTRNDQDAEDLVQEAYLRAFKFYHRFRGGDVRPWLLKIVRNAYYTWGRQNPTGRFIPFEDTLTIADQEVNDSSFANPEEVLIQKSDGLLIRTALEALPSRSREILVLRGVEGMSYNEISIVIGVPSGTVMSTLSRARARLRESIADHKNAQSASATR